MYLSRSFLPLPAVVESAFFVLFGPSLVVAFLGLFPLLGRPRRLVSVYVATVFGVIAGTVNMMFAVVQLTNLHYLRHEMAVAATPRLRELWGHILTGVFTVQNGLNITGDFFLDLTAFLYAGAMWRHPVFGKAFSLLAIALVGPHFVMKAVTFPRPPSEAGLFDAGPLVGLWFTAVTVQVIRHLYSRNGRTRVGGDRAAQDELS